ncbi:hypothetical protein Gotur_012036 [Gossypium turneri]
MQMSIRTLVAKSAILGILAKTMAATAWDDGKWWQRRVWGRRGKNLFLIVFELEEDLETVMEGQPWLFRKNLVIFDRLTKPMERDQIRLVSSPFWIKIGPCLPEFDKKDLLHAIGVTFGGVLRSEVNGSIKENQETYLHSEKNSDMIQGVQEDSWLTAT